MNVLLSAIVSVAAVAGAVRATRLIEFTPNKARLVAPSAVAVVPIVMPELASTLLGIVPLPATVPVKVGLGIANADGSVEEIDGTPPPEVTSTPLFPVVSPLIAVPPAA